MGQDFCLIRLSCRSLGAELSAPLAQCDLVCQLTARHLRLAQTLALSDAQKEQA